VAATSTRIETIVVEDQLTFGLFVPRQRCHVVPYVQVDGSTVTPRTNMFDLVTDMRAA